ncbi:uncharacterized protein LOC105696037 [Orussus abietinus]|uniref:uncharacterized protein LOC105696037 n=1 Tax=Orussus abietinus TaxID=222816 RepID=UPI000625050A|nr:uncharacterized protein LOC105696037 [Orussus abietinus]
MNCLKANHQAQECRSIHCRKCPKKHHTLLHSDSQRSASSISPQPSTSVALHAHTLTQVVLSTVKISIEDRQGQRHICRALIDPGAQSHFITEKFVEKLQLVKRKTSIPVTGLNQVPTNIRHVIDTRINSIDNEYNRKLTFLIIPEITQQLPCQPIDAARLDLPENLPLADPAFHIPAKIDALLGMEIFYDLLRNGQVKIGRHGAILQNSQLGWLIGGRALAESYTQGSHCYLNTTSLHKQMAQFWEIEEGPEATRHSPEEAACVKHFHENIERDHTGRFVVRLPFNQNINNLGESHQNARRRSYALEKELQLNPEMKEHYISFMQEYITLQHLELISKTARSREGYYLPHHPVIKEDSSTTKVRVVFDRSARTTSGLSLNDMLMSGPTVQDDVFTLLVRYRSFPVVLSADVEKMFRQIWIHPEDRTYQRILWREKPEDELKTCVLKTVSYRLKPSPYYAVGVLRTLAKQYESKFPRAAAATLRDFYMDDLLSGADTHEEAALLRHELIQLVKEGGFYLR